jgi:hypothetical protein
MGEGGEGVFIGPKSSGRPILRAYIKMLSEQLHKFRKQKIFYLFHKNMIYHVILRILTIKFACANNN